MERKSRYSWTTLIFFSAVLLFGPLGSVLAEPELTVGNYQLVASKRVSRFEFDYTYKADITNAGTDAIDVSATLVANAPGISVLDGLLEFGGVPFGASIKSRDTFSVRQDRRYSFSESALSWNVDSTTATLTIADFQPVGGPPGTEIHLIVDGVSERQGPLKLYLAEQQIAFSQDPDEPDRLAFLLPNDSVGGALSLAQGARISNVEWIRVPISGDRFITTPDAGVPYLDGGFNVWVEDNVPLERIQEIANEIGAIVTSKASGNLYYFLLTRSGLAFSEMRSIAQVIEEYEEIDLAVGSYLVGPQLYAPEDTLGTTDCSHESDPIWDVQDRSLIMDVPEGPNAHLEAIDALRGWNYLVENGRDVGGVDIAIGVLETNNLVTEHPDLVFVSGRGNGIDDITPLDYPSSVDSHGTHVTGIIGAEHNELGALGVLSVKRILYVNLISAYRAAPDFNKYAGEDNLIREASDGAGLVINESNGKLTPYWYQKNGVGYCLIVADHNGIEPVIQRVAIKKLANPETGVEEEKCPWLTSAPSVVVAEGEPGITQEDLEAANVFRGWLEEAEESANKRYVGLFRDNPNVLIVQAAGNNGGDGRGAGGVCAMTAAEKETNTFCVGNIDPDSLVSRSESGPVFRFRASSNAGDTVKIVSPGTNVCSTANSADSDGKDYKLLTGTSMAAPVVAGVAGLVWNAFPELSAPQVREAILAGSVGKGCPGGRSDSDCVPLVNAYGALNYAAETLAGVDWTPLPDDDNPAVGGACGSVDLQECVQTLSVSSPGLCAQGTVSNFFPEPGQWIWECQGTPENPSDFCAVDRCIDPLTGYITLQEGNPGIAGDGVFISNPVFGDEFGTYYEYSPSSPLKLEPYAVEGLQLSVYSDLPFVGFYIVVGLENQVNQCGATAGAVSRYDWMEQTPELFGTSGDTLFLSPAMVNDLYVSAKENCPDGSDADISELVVTQIRVTGPVSVERHIDAVATGLGQGSFPTVSTPPPSSPGECGSVSREECVDTLSFDSPDLCANGVLAGFGWAPDSWIWSCEGDGGLLSPACEVSRCEDPAPTIRYMTFEEGNPLVPGDNVFLDGTSTAVSGLVSYVPSAPLRLGPYADEGLQFSVFTEVTASEASFYMIASFLDQPAACSRLIAANPNIFDEMPTTPNVNGVIGNTIYMSPSSVLDVYEEAKQNCPNAGISELVLSRLLVVDRTQSGQDLRLDAAAAGLGLGTFPTPSTPPSVE